MAGPRIGRILSLLLLVAFCLWPAAGVRAATRTLTEALGPTPPERLIELRLDSGDLVRGHLVGVRNDTLYLRSQADEGLIEAHPVAAVVRVSEWRSNSRRGASWGATSGAIIVGGFGMLLGAVVASIDDAGNDNIGPIVGLTLLGAGVGAAGGSLLGLGVGSLSTSWQEIWPRTGRPDRFEPEDYSKATRLGLFAGSARALLDDYRDSRLAARVSLRKSIGRFTSLGPEISFHEFEGSERQWQGGTFFARSHENVLKVALVANVRLPRPGLSPYATTGFGWFISNDAYLGAHFGGGMRWQFDNGNDLELDIRYHFNLTDVDPGEVDRFWTIGVGLGLDL